MKLDSRYGEYANYFVRPLILKKSMYGITNSGNLFSDEITNWLIYEAGPKQSQCQISMHYKYAPDTSKLVVLSYICHCLYWYTSEELVK